MDTALSRIFALSSLFSVETGEGLTAGSRFFAASMVYMLIRKE
jgi:hypothetical protein